MKEPDSAIISTWVGSVLTSAQEHSGGEEEAEGMASDSGIQWLRVALKYV